MSAKKCGHADGLIPVEHYRRCASEANAQILAIKDADAVCAAVTLTVYRGAVVRTSSAATKVRSSKPMPGDLPANATRLVHVVLLQWHPDKGEYTASCAGEVRMLQPSDGSVLGELAADVKPSALRLHVRLSAASSAAMHVLASHGVELPDLLESPQLPAMATQVHENAQEVTSPCQPGQIARDLRAELDKVLARTALVVLFQHVSA